MGGSLLYSEIEDIFQIYPVFRQIQNFVETGTYRGDTAMMAARNFFFVYTIEIVPELFQESMKRAADADVQNIRFNLGDSLEKLPAILAEVKEGAFFFIDAHQSGADTGNNNKQRVPLLLELDLILGADLGPSVLIFDDVRFWKGESRQVWDWEHVSQEGITRRIREAGKGVVDSYVRNDRFFVLTN